MIIPIAAKNPWGVPGGIEPQRSDLWVLDLEGVLRAVKFNLDTKLDLPDSQTTRWFAKQVTFPEQRINELEVRELNTPKLYPGYDEPTPSVRVDFLMDSKVSASDAFQVNTNQSKIYNLLMAWRVLARIGRYSFSTSGLQALLPQTAIKTSIGSSFKFDVPVYMVRGKVPQSASVADADLGGMEVSSAFVLTRCWISSIQLGAVDYASNAPMTVTAALIPEEIHPLPLGVSGNDFNGEGFRGFA